VIVCWHDRRGVIGIDRRPADPHFWSVVAYWRLEGAVLRLMLGW
jgi:hypothetical protein